MLEPRDRPFFAILVVIALLLACVTFSLSFAESPGQPQNQNRQDNAQTVSPPQQPQPESFWVRTVDEPINLFTGVLALLTIALVGASIWQGRLTKKAVGISERALVDLERPYVFFQDTECRNPEAFDVTGHKTFTVIFKNYGKTPAILVSRRLACDLLKEPPDPLSIRELFMPSGSVIGADVEYPRGKVLVSETDDNAWRSGKGAIYLYGEIKYRDVFNKTHRTWFCREFNGWQFVLREIVGERFNGHE